jgi:hypothetical protein
MPSNLSPDIAALPLYQLGFHNGQDVGLRVALDQLTQERLKQERLLARCYPSSTKAARISYAEASLREVSKRVAVIFRQETTR